MTTTLPAPRLIDPVTVPALRWGVIGTGIADRFVEALHAHTTQRAVAVAARDAAKTQAFADRHGIAAVSTGTSALINDPDVDVVYIATPHPLHHALALEAIAAGKHVLIEKPIAMSAAEAEAMTAAGRAAGVLVMEAMWTRYLPQSEIIRQVLADGLLGEVHLVRADFGFSMPFLPDHRMWNAELGGGALLDAGVYPISFVSSVLGAPASVTANGAVTSTGVDARADLLLPAANGATGMASTSMVTSMPVIAEILGAAARLQVLSPFFGPSGLTLTTGSIGSEASETWRDDSAALYDGMSWQAIALAAYVGEGRSESPVHLHAEVVSVMATIDEARRQVAASGQLHTATSGA
jgi:predicted dehydrogenase